LEFVTFIYFPLIQTSDMTTLLRLLILSVLTCSQTGCLFKEPVFTEGFSKADGGLGGVWVTDDQNGDPRKTEFAVCAPLDEDRYVLHHPAGGKDGIYYEARPVRIRGHNLLQLRILASFSDGLPKADAERYTLLWVERDAAGEGLWVRALGGEGVKDKGPDAVHSLIEDPAGDWSKLFGDPTIFRRLKDR
jgi:hypothetical protein